jgi:PAS domain-containing protein
VRPENEALERAEQLAQTGTWEWDLETDVLLWSTNMWRLLGLEPDSVTPRPEYVIGRIHPDDRERVERDIHLAGREGTLPGPTYWTIWPDGRSTSYALTQPRRRSVSVALGDSSVQSRM